VGKTDIAVALCQRLGAEVVNADSVQVYRGLDIGSAKPTAEECARVHHHLVDVADPGEAMSAARWAKLAETAIADIHARDKQVLVVGGTGLYIKALLHGLASTPAVDPGLRAGLQRHWETKGGAALHTRLAALDTVSAARLHPADRQRVIRTLEVCLQTGRPFSERLASHGFGQARYPHLFLGLTRPREELGARIEARCRAMWQGELLDEVAGLMASGVSPDAPALASLGYRQALAYLRGEMEAQEALAEMITRTKAYAKRQLTWFRAVPGISWYNSNDLDGLVARALSFWSEQGSAS
jgi:tRNA dimethylallyltransferase